LPFLQFKPTEQSFLEMARYLDKHLDAVVLCEGPSDAELLKLVVGEPGMSLGVTDCGGLRPLYEVGRYVAALARVSRKLRSLGVVVNADEYEPADRARALAQSLREHGLKVGELDPVSEGLFRLQVEQRPLVICVAGLKDVPVDRHCIEDHVLRALIAAGDLTLNDIRRRAEELRRMASIRQELRRVSAKDVLETLDVDPVTEVRRLLAEKPNVVHDAFGRLIELIEELQRAQPSQK